MKVRVGKHSTISFKKCQVAYYIKYIYGKLIQNKRQWFEIEVKFIEFLYQRKQQWQQYLIFVYIGTGFYRKALELVDPMNKNMTTCAGGH